MGNRGRFGKYGDIKRLERIRRAGLRPLRQGKEAPQARRGRTPFGDQKGGPGASILVRPALDTDGEFIGRLSDEVFGIYGPYGEMIMCWFLSPMAVTFVAASGDRPIGFSMVGPLSEPSLAPPGIEVLALAVEPRNQKKGVGRILMTKTEEEASLRRVRRLWLHTALENVAARSLFARCGYVAAEIKSCFYPAGQDAILMIKELP